MIMILIAITTDFGLYEFKVIIVAGFTDSFLKLAVHFCLTVEMLINP